MGAKVDRQIEAYSKKTRLKPTGKKPTAGAKLKSKLLQEHQLLLELEGFWKRKNLFVFTRLQDIRLRVEGMINKATHQKLQHIADSLPRGWFLSDTEYINYVVSIARYKE